MRTCHCLALIEVFKCPFNGKEMNERGKQYFSVIMKKV